MAEYLVIVAFDGSGTLKVKAGSEEEAREDAEQMDLDDITLDSKTITVLHVEKESS